ncbi:hypothetical protein Tco_0719344 [Tanacetum coccineum]
MMSSPYHPHTSNFGDVVYFQIPNYVPRLLQDYVPTLQGKLLYASIHFGNCPTQLSPTLLISSRSLHETCKRTSFHSTKPFLPTPPTPQAFEIGETSRKSTIERQKGANPGYPKQFRCTPHRTMPPKRAQHRKHRLYSAAIRQFRVVDSDPADSRQTQTGQ